MGVLTRLASGVRAIPRAGLGNALVSPVSGKNKIKATTSSRWVTPGQPLYRDWDATQAIQIAYYGHPFVYRCLRTKADTMAGLPFRCGMDPDDPATTTPHAPLAQLLGAATPMAPGGPNRTTTSRALWAWSKVQFDVTGVMAWNTIRDPNKQIDMLYPLVSASLDAIPTQPGDQDWFDSYVYHTPTGDIPFAKDEVFYAWRPGADDWRQPESPLRAGKLPIQIARACDEYMWNLLKNGMVASHLVVSSPFDDEDEQRAWEDQFFAEFSGFDNAGKSIFAYAENDYDPIGKLVDKANVQVLPLSMTSLDAQLIDALKLYKTDITIVTGVPESLIGNAAERIYANADSEYRNFWTITMISDITEMQDMVNVGLAPQMGKEVGWFDLSRVVALQPPTIFMPPAITDALNAGIINVEQAQELLGIPNPQGKETGEDVDTAPIGEESASTGAGNMGGGRSYRSLRPHGIGSDRMELPDGWGWRHRPLTTFTLNAGNAGWGIVRQARPRMRLSGVRVLEPAPIPELATATLSTVAEIRARREGQRDMEGWLDRLGDELTELLPA